MLEIDRGADDERPAPSAQEAQLARDAAQATLDALPRERETLTAAIADAVGRGAFEEARSARDKLALAEDRAVFAQAQLARAELSLLECEIHDLERDAARAGQELIQCFAQEEKAQQAYQQAGRERAGAQARVQSHQLRLEGLRRQHEDAKRRIEQHSA